MPKTQILPDPPAIRPRDMTPDEYRLWENARKRHQRARRKTGELPPPRDPTRRTNNARRGAVSLLDAGAPLDACGAKTIALRLDIARRLRNAAACASPERPQIPATETALIENALKFYLDALEELYNNSQPFPDP